MNSMPPPPPTSPDDYFLRHGQFFGRHADHAGVLERQHHLLARVGALYNGHTVYANTAPVQHVDLNQWGERRSDLPVFFSSLTANWASLGGERFQKVMSWMRPPRQLYRHAVFSSTTASVNQSTLTVSGLTQGHDLFSARRRRSLE